LNPGGGTTEDKNRRWGNAVSPRSPLLWPLLVNVTGTWTRVTKSTHSPPLIW